ncbi:inositol monophosphatase family protein [Cohnella sp. AR92]|uniref:inositol monophosphatase family protein n=1 Tax=Cohnella sp. AR92 TaxID=648716 RepID=UPI0013153D13
MTYKSAGELVTSADLASDKTIRDAISSSYPQHIPHFAISATIAVDGTGFPHDKAKVHPALARVNILTTHCRDIRRLAAPAIDICYVASGKLDAHTESLAPWDVAAAGLIAREAGMITGHVGAVPYDVPQDLFGEEFISANPGIYEELLNLLRTSKSLK